MFRKLLVAALAFNGLAIAADSTSSTVHTLISTTSTVHCSLGYGKNVGQQPSPLPTSATTVTISSATTRPTDFESYAYTRVAGDPVTTTVRTSTSILQTVVTVSLPSTTVTEVSFTTFATGTWASTRCTNGVTPKSTVTEYTGTYVPVSGQETAPASTPTEAFCTTSLTKHLTIYPTFYSGTGTITDHSTVSVDSITTTVTATATFGVVTSYATTYTQTSTSYVPTATLKDVPTACETIATRTLDARCAPTNLISSINGQGILGHSHAANVSVVYTRQLPWGTDPSLCCQVCLDSPGCGATMGDDGACGLYFAGSPSGGSRCGEHIFSYSLGGDIVAPGSGIIVSNGCGTTGLEI